MTKTRIFFMHIAKTAGSSVNKVFAELYPETSLVHIEGKPDWQNALDGLDYVSGHIRYPVFASIDAERKFRYVTFLRDPISHLRSHLNWVKVQTTDQRHRPFISKNDEIRTLSEGLAKIDLKNPVQIRDYLLSARDNPQCMILFDNCQSRYFVKMPPGTKVLLGDFRRAVVNFASFDFVGISEEFDRSMAALMKTIAVHTPLPRVTENVESYDKKFDRVAFREVLSDFVGYDCALYELALTRFRESGIFASAEPAQA